MTPFCYYYNTYATYLILPTTLSDNVILTIVLSFSLHKLDTYSICTYLSELRVISWSEGIVTILYLRHGLFTKRSLQLVSVIAIDIGISTILDNKL